MKYLILLMLVSSTLSAEPLTGQQQEYLDLFVSMSMPRTPPAPFSDNERISFCQELDSIQNLNVIKRPKYAQRLARKHTNVVMRAQWLNNFGDDSHRNPLARRMTERYPMVWIASQGRVLCGAWFQGDKSKIASNIPDPEPIVGESADVLYARNESVVRELFPAHSPDISTVEEFPEELPEEIPLEEFEEEVAEEIPEALPICEALENAVYDLNHIHEPGIVAAIRAEYPVIEDIHVVGRYNRYVETKSWGEHYPLLWVILEAYQQCPAVVYAGIYNPQPLEY